MYVIYSLWKSGWMLGTYLPCIHNSNQGPVVWGPIKASPGLNVIPSFFFFCSKEFNFLYSFESIQSSDSREKELNWICFLIFHIWIQILYEPWVILTQLWTTLPWRLHLQAPLFTHSTPFFQWQHFTTTSRTHFVFAFLLKFISPADFLLTISKMKFHKISWMVVVKS